MNKSLINKIQYSFDQIGDGEKRNLLNNLRNEIDQVDKSISDKLLKRTKLVYLIGKLKKSLDISSYSIEREKQIMKNIASVCDDPVIQKSLKNIYQKIIEESRLLQKLDPDLSQLFGKDKSKG